LASNRLDRAFYNLFNCRWPDKSQCRGKPNIGVPVYLTSHFTTSQLSGFFHFC
jgi:hypothetical protein